MFISELISKLIMKIFWRKNLLALPVLELQNKKVFVCVKKRETDRQRNKERKRDRHRG